MLISDKCQEWIRTRVEQAFHDVLRLIGFVLIDMPVFVQPYPLWVILPTKTKALREVVTKRETKALCKKIGYFKDWNKLQVTIIISVAAPWTCRIYTVFYHD